MIVTVEPDIVQIAGLDELNVTDSPESAVAETVNGASPKFSTITASKPALSSVTSRPSRNARYLAVTVTFTATSRAQLDDIYRTLSVSEQVLFLL